MHGLVGASSVIGMTTTTPLVYQQRLPEHIQRLHRMTLVPDVFNAMFRLDTTTGQGAITTINAGNRFGMSTRMIRATAHR
jgi:hypothetical protein